MNDKNLALVYLAVAAVFSALILVFMPFSPATVIFSGIFIIFGFLILENFNQ